MEENLCIIGSVNVVAEIYEKYESNILLMVKAEVVDVKMQNTKEL